MFKEVFILCLVAISRTKKKGFKMKNFGKARVLCVNALAFCILIVTSSCFAATQLPDKQKSGEEIAAEEVADQEKLERSDTNLEALASFIKVNIEMMGLCEQKAQKTVQELYSCDFITNDDLQEFIRQAMKSAHTLVPKYDEAFQLLSKAHQDAMSNFEARVAIGLRNALMQGNYASIGAAFIAVKNFNAQMLSGTVKALMGTATEEKEKEIS